MRCLAVDIAVHIAVDIAVKVEKNKRYKTTTNGECIDAPVPLVMRMRAFGH